jgi:hypothetical protein
MKNKKGQGRKNKFKVKAEKKFYLVPLKVLKEFNAIYEDLTEEFLNKNE